MKNIRRIDWFAPLVFVLLCCFMSACGEEPAKHKVVVLGVDGMDYGLLRKWMDQGLMPNFEALAREGGLAPLGTSIPPESPVAWSNFITGQNPGGHGIFDFLHRKFEHGEVEADFSMSGTNPVTSSITLFGYEFPLAGGDKYNKRQGTAFWEVLEDHDIPATVFKIPCQSPPTPTDQKTLSGMGTPDLLSDYGNYRLYTDDPKIVLSAGENRKKIISVSMVGNEINDFIYGPPNALKAGEEKPITSTPLTIYLDPETPVAKILIGEEGSETAEFILHEKEWSDFVELKFEMMPYLLTISGITRFYLKEARPNFTLFMDAINLNPLDPAEDISTPPDWASELAERYGYFYTVGMPENTAILKENALSYDVYREHSMLIFNKRKEMLYDFIDRHDSGLLFYYFCSIDLDSHMYWRCMDPAHPGHDAEEGNEGFIQELYTDMDGILGDIRKKLDPQDTLIVMSDHGFAPYYRAINLNTWLLENGYLALKEGADRQHADLWTSVDWTRSKAYNVGFASLYLNVKGREPQGIVDPADVNGLVDEICGRLMKLTDPQNGEKVFLEMFKTRECYSGAAVREAPDIVVGCRSKYRVSDESTLGNIPEGVIHDNLNPWSGCHVMAAEEVPGILVTNRKIALKNPKLYDLTVTLLKEYGIDKIPQMVGQPIFE